MTDRMTTERTLFTRRDYDQLPEGFPCELIEGELVKEPSPYYQHQRVVTRITHVLAERVGVERVVCSPIDVVLNDLNVLQPDVAVFADPLPAGLLYVPLPAVVIEVLSRSTVARDRVRKTRLYLAHGVREVWLLDPFDGTIEVCTRDSRAAHGADDLVASAVVPELTVRGCDLVR